MTTKKRRAIAFLTLLALLLSFALSACSQSPQNADETKPAEVAEDPAAAAEEEETAKLLPDLPEGLNYSGATVLIMQHPFSAGDWADWLSRDIWSDGITGEPINDAVFERNAYVEEKLGVVIRAEDVADMPGTIQRQVTSGTADYNISTARIQSLPATVTKGYLVNLYDMPHVDLTKPWYDERCIADASYYGLLYYVTGDMIILDDDSTGAMVFNKQLIEDYHLEVPYDLVEEGTWTLDKMADMANSVASDLNGNGEVDIEGDRFGLLWQRDAIVSFMHGSEARIVDKDESGEPYYTITSEHANDVFSKIDGIFFDPTVVQNMHNYSSKYPDIYVGECNIFRANNALFMWMRMRVAQNLRDMETDFGIIPVPKYDEAQSKYYSTVTKYTAATVCIPNTSAIDWDMTGAVVELMNAEGHYGLHEAYYENNLGSKISRDRQSTEMLDLIFSNRIYDAGEIYELGSISSNLYSRSAESAINLATMLAKNAKIMERSLDKTFVTPLKELAEASGRPE